MKKKTIHKIAELNTELRIALYSDDTKKINTSKAKIKKILFAEFWNSLKGDTNE